MPSAYSPNATKVPIYGQKDAAVGGHVPELPVAKQPQVEDGHTDRAEPSRTTPGMTEPGLQQDDQHVRARHPHRAPEHMLVACM